MANFDWDSGNPLGIFGALFGKPQAQTPAQPEIPQAPINYDRMSAILNSGILKNPNASMDVKPKPTPTPTPTPAPQKVPNFFDMIFGRLYADQERLRRLQSDEAFYRRMNNVDGGS